VRRDEQHRLRSLPCARACWNKAQRVVQALSTKQGTRLMCGCGIRHDAWVWHSHFVPCSPQRSSSARYWTFQTLAVSYYLAHDELPAAGSCKYLVLKSIWSSTTRWKTIGSVHTALCRIRTELQLACEPRGASPASEPRGASPASEPRGASPASEPRGASPPSIAPPPIRASIVEFESSLFF
jgi:hypothetical protein